MKYVSLVFIIGLMWWSWSAVKSPSRLSEATHMGIQADLRRVITEYIEQNVPHVQNIQFEKFWTETIKKNKVKATFSYTFEEAQGAEGNAARIGIDGHAILNQIKDETGQFDLWSLDELYVFNNRIDFKEGVSINPEKANSATDTQPKDK